MNKILLGTGLLALLLVAACEPPESMDATPEMDTTENVESSALLDKYTSFKLTTDVGLLSENERQMIPLLIEAADAMNEIFWIQAYGNKDALLASIEDPDLKKFALINYGPWDRLDGNKPFVEGAGPKPAGSNLYPVDITKEELEAAAAENDSLTSLYTMVRRGKEGELEAIPYHVFFANQMQRASGKLKEAAALAEDPGLKKYLELRSEALLRGNYQPSDLAWMDMKDNTIDIVVGPIETYEDGLLGAKAAAEAYVLVKDRVWSERLAHYTTLLPMLQEGLPVPDEYKQETPGTDSDLGAYDAIYYAGDCNAGSKTIAINLPNDEEVQLHKGTRRLQLKNAMQAKFDKILLPIANELIAEDQREHVTFDAFFGNTMFHEVAHGLGIKNTLTGNGTVRTALQDHASAMEEGKADVLGLYMVTKLQETGDWDAEMMDHYVTFAASIFRSIRFGTASAHGRANLIRFNFFEEMNAFTRDEETGTYRVDPEKMAAAVTALSEKILTLQGDGDYDAVAAFATKYQQISPQLQADLDKLDDLGIPSDIIFEQGVSVLDLDA